MKIFFMLDVARCRGGESDSRHEDFQSSALPLSYLGNTYNEHLTTYDHQTTKQQTTPPLAYPKLAVDGAGLAPSSDGASGRITGRTIHSSLSASLELAVDDGGLEPPTSSV